MQEQTKGQVKTIENDEIWGLNAAVTMMVGAAIGGFHLTPPFAGSFIIAACIVAGAGVGWLLGYLATLMFAKLIGWQAVAILQLLSIHAALAGMGGVAATLIFDASLPVSIAVACLTALLHVPLLFVAIRRIKAKRFDASTELNRGRRDVNSTCNKT
ncbi:hypothetical protein SH528x_003557 [Novipirellula sp. SH528]|uniref:hypothetical protein n=1 Tax=Novipirellula sp. SH528 TaxID=3454466 RepID=UPI003F9FF6CC